MWFMIGNQDYTFVNAAQFPTAGPYSVLINTTAAGTAAQILGSLTNLADAVNGPALPAPTLRLTTIPLPPKIPMPWREQLRRVAAIRLR